jgi:hypothetical protein
MEKGKDSNSWTAKKHGCQGYRARREAAQEVALFLKKKIPINRIAPVE